MSDEALTANPDMLVLARDSREMTQSAVAAAMSDARDAGPPITQGYVSKAESGAVVVAGERLGLFATVLEYPRELLALREGVYGFATSCVHHRKRQSLPVAALRRIHAYLNLARIQMHGLLDGTNVLAPLRFFRFELSELDTAQDAAKQVRARWGVPAGPIVSMLRLLEDAGGLVVLRDTASRAWDAVSQWPADESPVFLLNAATPTDRQRFSLAHELGHVICHPTPAPGQEQQADEFAAEFLMPATEIAPELGTDLNIEKLGQLKQRWKVSMAALVRRARDLSLINDWRYRSLNVELSSLGYRRDEPGALDAEQPCLAIRAAHERVRHGEGVELLAARALLTPNEFTTIFDLHDSATATVSGRSGL
jgi:Zn-dependent peptidase ImmA (M78 family)